MAKPAYSAGTLCARLPVRICRGPIRQLFSGRTHRNLELTSVSTTILPDQAPSAQRLKIRPKVGWQAIDLGELWHYRELLWILAARDIKVRYKQTALGFAWAFIQPFATTFVYIIIGTLGSLSTGGAPRPLFSFCGLLPWLLFSNSINAAGNSLVSNQHLISKVYFPRLVLPISSILTSLVDFAISFAMLLALMAWYALEAGSGFHFISGWQLFLLPLFILMSVTAALAGGLWLSALNVEYRDVRYAIPLLLNVMQFCTPLMYAADQIKRPWIRNLIGINPMSGVVEGFRWCMIGTTAPGPMLWVSVASILLLLVGGLFYFRRMEKSFADLV
jgi:lipopolysaccharide transport system permease protein